MNCCSKRKKRWPVIVFLLIIVTAILLAVISDANAKASGQCSIVKTQSQLPDDCKVILHECPMCNVVPTPIKANDRVSATRKGDHG